jgi:hypothetical protein
MDADSGRLHDSGWRFVAGASAEGGGQPEVAFFIARNNFVSHLRRGFQRVEGGIFVSGVALVFNHLRQSWRSNALLRQKRGTERPRRMNVLRFKIVKKPVIFE